jgi:hypothetical protein
MDAAVVGDTAPIPLRERPELQAIGEGDEDERIARGVAITADIHERAAGVWRAIVEAAVSDPDVDAWRQEVERRRRDELTGATARMFGEPIDDHLLTMVWIVYSAETYLSLVRDEGYSRADYEAFLIRATKRLASLR